MLIRLKIRQLQEKIKSAAMMVAICKRLRHFDVHETYDPSKAEAADKLAKEYEHYILEHRKEIDQLEAIRRLPRWRRLVSLFTRQRGSN
jgi:hypothetical protein